MTMPRLPAGTQSRSIISDTLPSPIIAWGWATTCTAPPDAAGVVLPPADEADRCRLAALRSWWRATSTVRWTQGFAAHDMVQRVVIAADQGVSLIDTAFAEDLPRVFKARWFRAVAGITAWSGMLRKGLFGRFERRPNFYAQKQLVGHLKGYDAITRVAFADDRVRVYIIEKAAGRTWVCWLDPQKLILPGDTVPQAEIAVKTGTVSAAIESVYSRLRPYSARHHRRADRQRYRCADSYSLAGLCLLTPMTRKAGLGHCVINCA